LAQICNQQHQKHNPGISLFLSFFAGFADLPAWSSCSRNNNSPPRLAVQALFFDASWKQDQEQNITPILRVISVVSTQLSQGTPAQHKYCRGILLDIWSEPSV
jgi:hypothetical protein